MRSRRRQGLSARPAFDAQLVSTGAPHMDAARLGARASFAGARAYQVVLKLGKPAIITPPVLQAR